MLESCFTQLVRITNMQIEKNVPMKRPSYKHRTPYQKATIHKTLPILLEMEPGDSVLVPTPKEVRAGHSRALGSVLMAASYDQLPGRFEAAVDHDAGGIRIWRLR